MCSTVLSYPVLCTALCTVLTPTRECMCIYKYAGCYNAVGRDLRVSAQGVYSVIRKIISKAPKGRQTKGNLTVLSYEGRWGGGGLGHSFHEIRRQDVVDSSNIRSDALDTNKVIIHTIGDRLLPNTNAPRVDMSSDTPEGPCFPSIHIPPLSIPR